MSNFKEKAQIFVLVGVAMMIVPFILAQLFSHLRRKEGQFRDDLWDHLPSAEREQKIDEFIVRENLAKLAAQERLELPPPPGDKNKKTKHHTSAKNESASANTSAEKNKSGDTEGTASSHTSSRFQPPNFNGPPHAVLGLPANPNKEQVLAAFRHWLKRYHPDHVAHLGKRFEEQAKRRASQIIEAKEALLKRISG